MPFIKQVTIFTKKADPVIEPDFSPNIDAGSSHAALIDPTGSKYSPTKMFVWGLNTSGQLGDNTITTKFTPVSVVGSTKTFCKISLGDSTTLALDKNGKAWGWGFNTYGMIGDNTTISKRTPVAVGGATKTFCHISTGWGHTAAIDKNGRAWTWGFNLYGQLGDNSTTQRNTPVSVAGTTKIFCRICANKGNSFTFTHTLALDNSGRAWAWGYNAQGQLGNNSTISARTPVSVLGAIKTFCKISAGIIHNLAIDKNGKLWSWGNNGNGELGDNTTTNKSTPVAVGGATKTFCVISAGANAFSLAIDKYGRVWGWGLNSSGQLGDNTRTRKLTPVSICGATKTFCDISAGLNFSLAVDKNGNAWVWGSEDNGALGTNTPQCRPSLAIIGGTAKTFCEISAGLRWTNGGIDNNGKIWGWGYNGESQIGNNSTTSSNTPVSIAGATKTFSKISIGQFHSLAIDKIGKTWSWGRNAEGQLGNNSTISSCSPIAVCMLNKTFCNIRTGLYHSVATDTAGLIWSWGANVFGALGDNTTTQRNTPVSIAGTRKTFCQISTGEYFTIGLTNSGRAWSWGYNIDGALGDGLSASRRTPVLVAGIVKTFCKIISGGSTTLAITYDGRLWGWGGNAYGQLGNNATLGRCTPVCVCGTIKTFCQISLSKEHALAIDKAGKIWAWGDNTYGTLGDGTFLAKSTPIAVCIGSKTFCKVGAGLQGSLAIDKNGQVWGWGLRLYGALGDFQLAITPVRVCSL